MSDSIPFQNQGRLNDVGYTYHPPTTPATKTTVPPFVQTPSDAPLTQVPSATSKANSQRTIRRGER